MPLVVWLIIFIALNDLPRMLVFLLCTCVTCVIVDTNDPLKHGEKNTLYASLCNL